MRLVSFMTATTDLLGRYSLRSFCSNAGSCALCRCWTFPSYWLWIVFLALFGWDNVLLLVIFGICYSLIFFDSLHGVLESYGAISILGRVSVLRFLFKLVGRGGNRLVWTASSFVEIFLSVGSFVTKTILPFPFPYLCVFFFYSSLGCFFFLFLCFPL